MGCRQNQLDSDRAMFGAIGIDSATTFSVEKASGICEQYVTGNHKPFPLRRGEVVAAEPDDPGLARIRVRMEDAEAKLPVPGAAEGPAVVIRDLHAEFGRLRFREGHRLIPEDEALAEVDAARRDHLQDRIVVRLDDPDVVDRADLSPLQLLGMPQDVVFLEEWVGADRARGGPVENAYVTISRAEIWRLERAIEVVAAELEMCHAHGSSRGHRGSGGGGPRVDGDCTRARGREADGGGLKRVAGRPIERQAHVLTQTL